MAPAIVRSILALASLAKALAAPATIVEGAFIVKLAQIPHDGLEARHVDHHALFHKRAANVDYSVRQEFRNRAVYNGLAVDLPGVRSVEEGHAILSSIEGVEGVAPVYAFSIPHLENGTSGTAAQFASFDSTAQPGFPTGNGSLGRSLVAGGVDKLHALGIKGKGITIGIIDTGVDYRHPALGGGFGPGYKVIGGHSWVDDNGAPVNKDDPLQTCFGGSHGTHVAGIIGMNPLAAPQGLPLTGVAPEASLRMYRIFNCAETNGTSDLILAAMSKAHDDGVDVVSMSLSTNEKPPVTGLGDPLADAVKALTNAGIGVVVAESNSASGAKYGRDLYTSSWPAIEPTALGVASMANLDYPLTYNAADSAGTQFQYASIWPIPAATLDVYLVPDGGFGSNWDDAIDAVTAAGKINTTIFAVEVSDNVRPGDTTLCCVNGRQPKFVIGLWDNTTMPYNIPLLIPTQARIGSTQWVGVNITDSANLLANYNAAGGFGKYKLVFPSSPHYSSPPQNTGGMIDYYSSFGPVPLNYTLKPEIAAPGGNILSTYPIGPLGWYAILSGTSMATPYIAGCYALVKSQFPNAKPEEIKAILQKSAHPLQWIYDRTILSGTAQQGAGLVNVYESIKAETDISPGHIQVQDVTHTLWGAANITLTNKGKSSKTYTLGHKGAGYMDYYLEYMEASQLAQYGSATFSPSGSINVAAGKSAVVTVQIQPPANVKPDNLPVFGGFITVHDAAGQDFSIPYIGPPYSLYNTAQLNILTGDVPSPRVGAYLNGSDGDQTYIKDLAVLNSTTQWSSTARWEQWTTVFRLDVLPANTSLVPNHYGFNASHVIPYQATTQAPKSSFVGYPSYGFLTDLEGYNNPGNSPYISGTGYPTTQGADGTKYKLGPGDYRWLYSVLRWGGDKAVLKDWDTWLGPVVRFV